jgi:hypothetical protein
MYLRMTFIFHPQGKDSDLLVLGAQIIRPYQLPVKLIHNAIILVWLHALKI